MEFVKLIQCKRLERYRNILREINRTNKINDANIVSAYLLADRRGSVMRW